MFTLQRRLKKGRPGSRKANGRSDNRLKDISKAIEQLQVTTALKPTPGIRDISKTILKPIKKYTIKQNYFSANLVTSTSLSTFGSIVIQLNQFINQTAFAQIFDAYRFQEVTVRFVPTTPPAGGVGNTPLLTVIDYDDGSVPTSTASLRAYDTLYETPFGMYQERTFSPRYAVGTYSGAVFTSFSQMNGWCDIASNTVQWYGLKFGIDTTASAYTAWSIEVEAIIQFKSVR